MEFGGEEENQNGDESRFPFRLYNMLEQAHTEGYEAVVSWLPNGRAFRVHKREEFMKRIAQKYCNVTKYKSFLRQLNLYKFERESQGPDKGKNCLIRCPNPLFVQKLTNSYSNLFRLLFSPSIPERKSKSNRCDQKGFLPWKGNV